MPVHCIQSISAILYKSYNKTLKISKNRWNLGLPILVFWKLIFLYFLYFSLNSKYSRLDIISRAKALFKLSNHLSVNTYLLTCHIYNDSLSTFQITDLNSTQQADILRVSKVPSPTAFSGAATKSVTNTLPMLSHVCTGDFFCVCTRCLLLKAPFLPRMPLPMPADVMSSYSNADSINSMLRMSRLSHQLSPTSSLNSATSETKSLPHLSNQVLEISH